MLNLPVHAQCSGNIIVAWLVNMLACFLLERTGYSKLYDAFSVVITRLFHKYDATVNAVISVSP